MVLTDRNFNTSFFEVAGGAGNILYMKNGTSEALRDGVVVNLENVKRVSDHVPKHLKPLNNEQLGYYLAGLIDGDGHFSKAQQLVITFSSPDAFLAYYLKGRLGYGNVRKVKDKNAYLLIVSNEKGMLNIINLINGKLRTEHRFNQVVNNVLSHTNFQIKIIKRITRNKPEIRLNFQIDQKSVLLLNIIKEYLGGNIGYRKSQDTYYYGSTSFGSAKRVIEYFDRYHLQSRKHISYLR
ncbi:hypothetical protein COCMIDRAFT_41619 [Bipolaris oryzae ATCC 44560]|uniref:Homing endonuclease LAGLIDADG domain-containing protein n=1 Tax=Bipolaris oryzae ATCC 44560 TaxID=930090 RepID=W6YLA2_COCMI|nr:uncharacterized protein COCMIDRAFT_41619 [Bipolaris oryzae ATCC 44560]EUC39977.1 hypothetical protein COCMIDRAFT_41619 [Bipolaris oryzae ATCC 44560]